MLIVLTMSGYSKSVSPVDLSYIVSHALLPYEKSKIIRKDGKALFKSHQIKRIKKFIREYDDPSNSLLCVGKSLGAYNLVQALNELQFFKYEKSALLTIDPNWPLFLDWTPNLNNQALNLKAFLNWVVNIYALRKPCEQAGAFIVTEIEDIFLKNVALMNYTHQSIITAPEVSAFLKLILSKLM